MRGGAEAARLDERTTRSRDVRMPVPRGSLLVTPNGSDYTGAEGCAWLAEAGFRDTRVEPLAGSASMVVGTK